MSLYVNNKLRIKRNALQQDDMNRLTGAHIFESYKDILMISAILGFNQDSYVKIEKNASDGVLMQFFKPSDLDYIDYIAFARTKDKNIINKDEKYEIFSNYANGGFPILLKSLGITDDEITTDIARKAIVKYYSLLLSNTFVNLKELESEELDNELFKS